MFRPGKNRQKQADPLMRRSPPIPTPEDKALAQLYHGNAPILADIGYHRFLTPNPACKNLFCSFPIQ